MDAGITGRVVEYGPTYDAIDWRGNHHPARAAYPTVVVPNPDAKIYSRLLKKLEIWYLDVNPLCAGWGIAICGGCRGTG